MYLLHTIAIISIHFGIVFSNRSIYKLDKISRQAFRVDLNDNSSSYRNILDKVSKPTLNVSRLQAIVGEAYKCKTIENPDYIDVMLNPLIKPYNFRGRPNAEELKINTTSCRVNSVMYQVAKLWNEMPSFIKEGNSLFHSNHFCKMDRNRMPPGSCILFKV